MIVLNINESLQSVLTDNPVIYSLEYSTHCIVPDTVDDTPLTENGSLDDINPVDIVTAPLQGQILVKTVYIYNPDIADAEVTIQILSGIASPIITTRICKKIIPPGKTLIIDGRGNIWVDPEEADLPIASATVLGGIKVGDRLSIDAEGKLSADVQGGGSFIVEEGTPVNEVAAVGTITIGE